MDNRSAFFQKFVELGLSPQQALGALYGLGGESGAGINSAAFRANDAGPGNNSYGAGQWNRSRADNLMATAKNLGINWQDPAANVAHMANELTGKYGQSDDYSSVLSSLKQAKDTRDATDIWTRMYESPKINNSAARFTRGTSNVGTVGDDGAFIPARGGRTNTANSDDGPVVVQSTPPVQPTGTTLNSSPQGMPWPGTPSAAAVPGASTSPPPAPSAFSQMQNGDWKGAFKTAMGSDAITGGLSKLTGALEGGGSKPAPAVMQAPVIQDNTASIAAPAAQMMAALMQRKKIPGLSLSGIGGY